MPLPEEPYDFSQHVRRNGDASDNATGLAKKCESDFGLKNIVTVHLVPNKGTLDSGINIATTREVQLFDPEAHRSCKSIVKKAFGLLPDKDRDGCVDAIAFNGGLTAVDYNGNGKIQDPADTWLLESLTNISSSMPVCRRKKDWDSTIEHLCANGIDKLGITVQNRGSTMVHEFGHKFQLFDTRAINGSSSDPAWSGVTVGNCFITDSEKICRAQAPWRFLFGNGCGRSGVEDCARNNPSYDLEVGCFEGCIADFQSFRPERASTYAYGIGIPEGSKGSQELGVWNEWYISQVMKGLLEL